VSFTLQRFAGQSTEQQQPATRSTFIVCTISSLPSISTEPEATLTIPVQVRGVAQPSFQSLCTNTSAVPCLPTSDVGFSASLTTSGENVVVVRGGTCKTCPQPAFAPETSVTIAGFTLDRSKITVSASGDLLVFTTPSALGACVLFVFQRSFINTYFPLSL